MPKKETAKSANILKMDVLKSKNQEALEGGGPARIKKQHERGKLTARERVELLFDENSFHEIGKFV